MPVEYILKRNVGTVGRPSLACAVCGWSPSGHLLSAQIELEPASVHDKGLCNVHARGLSQNEVVTEEKLEQMRDEWLASR